MSFTAATSYLLGTINETISRRHLGGLERMEMLLREIGDPHRAYPTLHVGGTSGKGSTATMLAATLTAAGHRCGLHVKPHLASMTERIRLDGIPIAESNFATLLEEIRPALDRVATEYGRPTYYETLLALAFLAFARAEVDCAVIEVGLGGRLDGTNLILPEVSIITNVGRDHTEILGETPAEIATEKAGIIKASVPIITDAVGAAREVIAQRAQALAAPLFIVDQWTEVTEEAEDVRGQRFRVATKTATYAIVTRAIGAFQRRNAATAILALEQISPRLRPDVNAVEQGFADLVLPGRMEYLSAHPPLLIDVAHNPEKMAALVGSVRRLFPERRVHAVVAISESKEVEAMLASLAELPGSFMATEFAVPGRRSIRADRLALFYPAKERRIRVVADPLEAVSVARRTATSTDLILVTGSTVIVGLVREWWRTTMQAGSSL